MIKDPLADTSFDGGETILVERNGRFFPMPDKFKLQKHYIEHSKAIKAKSIENLLHILSRECNGRVPAQFNSMNDYIVFKNAIINEIMDRIKELEHKIINFNIITNDK